MSMPPLSDETLNGPGMGMGDFDMENLTEAQIEQLMSAGVIDENMAENLRQQQMQEALRTQAQPEGRDSGRVYTAANPLEHIGTLMEKYNANKKIGALEQQRGTMQGQQTDIRKLYADLLRGKRAGRPIVKDFSQDEILRGLRMPSYGLE
jgi:hypothetical protein